MRTLPRLPSLLFAASLAVGACAAGPGSSATPMPGLAADAPPVNSPQPLTVHEQLGLAVADLAGRTGVSADAVERLQGRTVHWRSGALGCPEPGQMYTQALVPGVQLVLGVERRVYHYHAAAGAEPFLCPDGRREAPAGAGNGLD